MSDSATTAAVTEEDDLVADLEAAHSAYEAASERVAERGAEDLQAVAEAHEELLGLFDSYEDRATGDGDFAVFIEFQEAMAKFTDSLPEDLPHREDFETVDDLMQQRRLTESDFEQARETLSPVAEDVALLEERAATRSRYADLRQRARRRLRELDERIGELESLARLGEADLDAPVERLRDPIDAYNDAVADAFTEFKRESGARSVLAFVATTEAFPLVPFESPPDDLAEYVRTEPPGTEPIPQLLEYAEYSRSKLSHYVADPDRLKRTVASHRTYLRRLSASPVTVDWPPPERETLRWRLRELIQVTGRFAPEDVVARLRDLRDTLETVEYERLRRSGAARDQLDETQHRRVADGEVAEELAATRQLRDDIADALERLPEG
jgi:hypothetical protein